MYYSIYDCIWKRERGRVRDSIQRHSIMILLLMLLAWKREYCTNSSNAIFLYYSCIYYLAMNLHSCCKIGPSRVVSYETIMLLQELVNDF